MGEEHKFQPIHWHYESDRHLIQNTEFMEWFAALKREPHLEEGYGGPLQQSTGIGCWFDYYNDGYSTREAALSDMSYWEE